MLIGHLFASGYLAFLTVGTFSYQKVIVLCVARCITYVVLYERETLNQYPLRIAQRNVVGHQAESSPIEF